MIFNTGTGEMLKASLLMQVYSVAICKNTAHKKLVMDNLMDFAKTKWLVNLAADSPTKSADLVAFEKRLQTDVQSRRAFVPPPPPPPSTPTAAVSSAAADPGVRPAAEAAAGDVAGPSKGACGSKKNLFAFGSTAL